MFKDKHHMAIEMTPLTYKMLVYKINNICHLMEGWRKQKSVTKYCDSQNYSGISSEHKEEGLFF